jgi:molybdate transport system substrate-binding protein
MGETKLAVAANMSYVIKPLIDAFAKEHPQSQIGYTIGSSGKLTAQIMHGAAYDLFFSADMKYPKALWDANKTLGIPVIYAKGALALFSISPRDFSKGLSLLEDPRISRIAIANPLTAPYGAAAKEALQQVQLYEKLKGKFVYGESIAQTVTYATRAADIGIIAASVLYAPHMKQYHQGKHWIAVDPELYRPIDQGMVLLRDAKDNTEAKAFFDFMQSDGAKEILQSYGYK